MRKEQQNKRHFQTPHSFIPSLVHEIKAPLTAIKSLSQLVKISYHQKDENFFRQFEEIIPRQLERISRLVERLNHLGKHQKPRLFPAQINLLLQDTIALFFKRLEKEKIQLVEQLNPLPLLLIDPDQISQVFTNLILNAIESMSKIDSKPLKPKILCIKSRRLQGSHVCVEISDTGTGIPPENFDRIFDPFYSTKLRGSGLGLAIVEQIIRNHNGLIKVQSKTAKGTSFKIILPS